jgi:hypothetical protein
MDAVQMCKALRGCGPGSMLFVSYEAAADPSADVPQDQCRRHYVGTLSSLWITNEGNIVLTMFVENRNQFRTFNPALGRLLSIEVIDPVAKCAPSKLAALAAKLPDTAMQELAIKISHLIQERKRQGLWPAK